MGWLEALLAGARAASPEEAVATALGFVYILLAIRRHRACWIAGGASTAIYAFVFQASGLPLQSALQVGYVLLSGWGWWAWRGVDGDLVTPRRWPAARHLAALLLALLLSGLTLAWRGTIEPVAVADALGTWASVAATWMLVQRVAGNWVWWILIDLGLALLFGSQGLAFTAVLYLAFAGLAIAGWRAWRRALPAS